MKGKYPARFDLSGKVALVTGAASGLGAVFCKAMAGAGADVVCADRDVAGLARAAAAVEVEKAGSRALVVGCDVTGEVAVDDVVERTVTTFGTRDIMFDVNAICPGFYRSRLGPDDDPEFVAALTALTPAGRIAEASEIKGTAIYLASAASDFLNGSLIVADGGCLAK